MKIRRSNVQIASNVYPVKITEDRIDMQANSQFVSRITDKNALRRLVKIVHHGLNYDDLLIIHAKKIPGISDWQAERIGIPDTCALAPRGEKPWGIAIVENELTYVCKCHVITCERFRNECRPTENTHVVED